MLLAKLPPWLSSLMAAVAPGVLAGAQVAGLVFFLNPDLAMTWLVFTRALVLYSGMLGLLSGAVLFPLFWRRRGLAARVLPWTIAVMHGLGALLFWSHASRFAYYLPPGINDRLLRTGVLLAVAALVWFYTALLHSLQQRRYGARSQLGLAVLTLAALAAMVERRASFRPSLVPVGRRAIEAARPARICVIGLEAGTLDALLPLAEQGQVPFLATLLHGGSYARLKTLQPTWRVPLWTTLSTGKYPFKHGLLAPRVAAADFLLPGARLRLLPQWIGFSDWGTLWQASKPSDAAGRKALALWEILARHGQATGIVAWPGSAPLRGDLAFAASDRFFDVRGLGESEVQPPESTARLIALRRSATELGATQPFGPSADSSLLNSAVTDRWRQAVALDLLRTPGGEVRSLWLHLRGLGAVSARLYGGYAAAQQEGSQESADQRAAQQLTAYYAYVDGLVEEVVKARPFDLVAVVSAHGVGALPGWRRALAAVTDSRGSSSAAGQWEDGPDGVLILAGPGVLPGNLVADANLADVVPTLLYALGMPVGDDLDGRVLTGAFEGSFLARQPLSFLPTYESPPAAP